MKFMLIMRATDEALATSQNIPMEEMFETMGRYNETLVAAGVMAGGDGLSPPEEGAVIDFAESPPRVTEGPYGETEWQFNGYWLLDVETQTEAIEWAKKCPLGRGMKLEIRRIPGIDEFPQDNEWVQKEKGWIEDAPRPEQ